jgi:hypothetical protein
MFYDVIDTKQILTNYIFINPYDGTQTMVFDYVIGLLQKIGYPKSIIELQLDALLNRPNEKLRKLYIDENFLFIDIFIAINPQVITYKYHGETFPTVKILNQYISILTKIKPIQEQIPMIWLYCDERLNFTNYDELKKSMITINKYYTEDDKILDYFSLSTIDNLSKIGKIDSI